MKPREFDELIRQKFDQNDFEYNPRNWERLEDQLEGRAKKRSIMMWWLMPLAGVAASVALALGISAMWRQAATGNAGVAEFAQSFHYEHKQPLQDPQGAIQYATDAVMQKDKTIAHKNKKAIHTLNAHNKDEEFGINLQNALTFRQTKADKKFNLLLQEEKITKKDKKKEVAVTPGYNTFNQEVTKKAPKLTIFLSGGINQGNQNNGYVAGATIRRMVNDKVFIESDVAFASSNNTQTHTDMNPVNVYSKGPAAKTTETTGIPDAPQKPHLTYVPQAVTDNYNLSYAQVSPSIGVQIIKRLSVAAGPDFQQALADKRPAPAPVANQPFENVAVMPLFDVGFIGKTEYSVTKKVKAQVSYRKGINNILTPMDKFIDRDYLQVQVRWAIFNK